MDNELPNDPNELVVVSSSSTVSQDSVEACSGDGNMHGDNSSNTAHSHGNSDMGSSTRDVSSSKRNGSSSMMFGIHMRQILAYRQ